MRKFEIQLKSWFPLVIDSYLTYDTLNTFEIIKHSGRVLAILGPAGQVYEILNVLNFLVKANFLIPKNLTNAIYFGINFGSYTYDVSEDFKKFLEEAQNKAQHHKPNDWIQGIKVEDVTHNTVNIRNFNFTFVLEKLVEINAGRDINMVDGENNKLEVKNEG